MRPEYSFAFPAPAPAPRWTALRDLAVQASGLRLSAADSQNCVNVLWAYAGSARAERGNGAELLPLAMPAGRRPAEATKRLRDGYYTIGVQLNYGAGLCDGLGDALKSRNQC